MKVEIVKAEYEHIPMIAPNVREADVTEMWDSHMQRPEETLNLSLKLSSMAFTGMVDDEPVCMFGVAPMSAISEVGLPWLIATSKIEKLSITFLRRNRKVVNMMLDMYPRLENYVEESNVRAVNWLKYLGFKFGTPEPMGVFGKPFIKFWMDREF